MIKIENITKMELISKRQNEVIDIPVTAICELHIGQAKRDWNCKKSDAYKLIHCKEIVLELYKSKLDQQTVRKLVWGTLALSVISIKFKDGTASIYSVPQASECEEYTAGGFGEDMIALHFKKVDYYD